MAKRDVEFGKYFCGNKISDYGLKNHRVDYGTLAKAFDAVLANELYDKLYRESYGEIENGDLESCEDVDGTEYTPADAESLISELEEKIKKTSDSSEKEKIQDRINTLSIVNYHEVFQWYVISESGREILEDYTDEIVEYFPEYNVYFWGVTHCGTAWDYVLTDSQLLGNKLPSMK